MFPWRRTLLPPVDVLLTSLPSADFQITPVNVISNLPTGTPDNEDMRPSFNAKFVIEKVRLLVGRGGGFWWMAGGGGARPSNQGRVYSVVV